MSDDQKIAQLLFVAIPGQVETPELRRLVHEWRVGGVVLYAYNVETPEQVKRLTAALTKNVSPAPFVAIDQEGGIVKRLRIGVPVVPSNMALGATRSPELARRTGAAVGSALRELGFTMNFAPVLDVLTEPTNHAIGTRSFGDDPALVGELGAAFIEGQESAGIISVGKHFPGLGGVPEDPHKSLPRSNAGLPDLRARDLVPFRRSFATGLRAVMTGHVALPRITGDLPATLSHRVMTELLREEMRFDGIAISDALQMEALAAQRGYGTLALEAIVAGSDMVLALGTAAQRQEVYDTLRAAYRDGRLPKARVRSALRRILSVKADLKPHTRFSSPRVTDEIARRAVTLVRTESSQAPRFNRARALYIGPPGLLRRRLAIANSIELPARPTSADTARITATFRGLRKNTTLCITAAQTEEQFAIIRSIHSSTPDLPMVFVNLGSPHRVIRGPRAFTLLTYADDASSQEAAARVVVGEEEAKGRAPVALVALP